MMGTTPRALLLAALTTTLLLTAPACGGGGSGDPTQCNFNDDCAQPHEYCDFKSSLCTPYECTQDSDCEEGQKCSVITNTCFEFTPPGNTTPNTTPNNSTDNNATTPPVTTPTNNGTGNNSTRPDAIRPSVSSVSPMAGAQISPDTVFEITFSERMEPITVAPTTIVLESELGGAVELEVTYMDTGFRARATPKTALQDATSYTLTIKDTIRDVAYNTLDKEYSYKFYTSYDARAGDLSLAKKWAPLLYQELADRTQWRLDVPTRVDFDGDWDASNNLESVATTPAGGYGATVYYHVTESFTQLFIYYVLYYPARIERDSATGIQTVHEHDFTGAVFVIDKASDRLLFVEGPRITRDSDLLISFLNRDGGVSLPGEGRIRGKFGDGDLADGTHYPFYVPAKRHEACNWDDPEVRPPFDTCVHPARDFNGGKEQGILFKQGEQAQGLEAAVANADGMLEATYALAPLAQFLWLRRDSYGSTALFGQGFSYSPDGGRPDGPTLAGESEPSRLFLPRNLASNEDAFYGKTPFHWLVAPTKGNVGQWMIDPAWTMIQRYSMPESVSWSTKYCYDLFLGVNVDPNATCPDRQSP